MNTVVLGLLSILTLTSACKDDDKKKTGTVSGELQTVGTLKIADGSVVSLTTASTIKGTTDVTIESLKIPIFDMTITGSAKGGKIYQCTGTSEDCLVELVGTNLTDVLTGGTKAPDAIEVGTYSSLSVSYKPAGCSGGGDLAAPDLAATVRASVTYGGVKYYTNKATGLSIAGPAEDVSFGFGACNSRTVLEPAIDLKEGEAINVKAFVDLQAQFSIQEKLSTQTSFCINNPDYNVELCNNSVNIAADVSTKEPKIERYMLNPENSDKGCGGYMGLFFNEADVPFGGFLRVYRYEGQNCDVGGVFGNSSGGGLGVLRKNADGTLTIKDATEDLTPLTIFTAFKRMTHTGVVQAIQAQGEAQKDVNYTATKL